MMFAIVFLVLCCLAILGGSLPLRSQKAFVVMIGAMLVGVAWAYKATENEITGKAESRIKKHEYETVTRETSPEKYRRATNGHWMASGVSFFVAAVSYRFYRTHKRRESL